MPSRRQRLCFLWNCAAACVCGGKWCEFNLLWRRSLVSREGWHSAGTGARRWSSWIHSEDCSGSKRSWQENTEHWSEPGLTHTHICCLSQENESGFDTRLWLVDNGFHKKIFKKRNVEQIEKDVERNYFKRKNSNNVVPNYYVLANHHTSFLNRLQWLPK